MPLPLLSGCQVIGEVGLAHGGDLPLAHAYLDAIADAGAHGVKFQTHLAEEESTPEERWRIDPGTGETRFQYWQRTGFTPAQWAALAAHARRRGLHFLSSTFSLAGVALLQGIGVDAWKVASGEVTHEPLIRAMAATGLPVLISMGMGTTREIGRAIQWARPAPVCLLECASAYPHGPEALTLHQWDAFAVDYVGLSDHSGTIWPSLAFAARGACVVEVHVAMEEAIGPDVNSSLRLFELRQLVEGVRAITALRASRVTLEQRAETFGPMRDLFLRRQGADGRWLKRGEMDA